MEEREIKKVRTIQTKKEVHHLLALDYGSVLAVLDSGNLQVLRNEMTNIKSIKLGKNKNIMNATKINNRHIILAIAQGGLLVLDLETSKNQVF